MTRGKASSFYGVDQDRALAVLKSLGYSERKTASDAERARLANNQSSIAILYKSGTLLFQGKYIVLSADAFEAAM